MTETIFISHFVNLQNTKKETDNAIFLTLIVCT